MPTERAQMIQAFLFREGWGAANRLPLAGDASNRRYERLTDGPGGGGAVLMDAPSEKGEDTRPFLRIARHLAGLGFSAPRILAADEARGLLLLEDLGDALFSRVVAEDPAREEQLYLAATDVLIALHAHPAPEALDYGPGPMTDLAGLAWDWYGFGATGARDDAGKAAMQAVLTEAFAGLAPWTPVLVLRDYHAENLFWLPERKGIARVGLIDFQDAGLGHPAYDLVSLARDVRRDVAPQTARKMLDRYTAETGQDPEAFARSAATLSAQRNLRILGGFARLSLHFGKLHYVDLIPRVWARLSEDLSHPALAALRAAVQAGLPEPTQEILMILKAKCATVPTL